MKLSHSKMPRYIPLCRQVEKEQGRGDQAQERHIDQRDHPQDLLNLLAGRNAHNERNSLLEAQGNTSQTNRYCLLEGGYLLKCIASLMSILPLEYLSE